MLQDLVCESQVCYSFWAYYAMSQFIIVAKSFVGLLRTLFYLPEVQGEKLAFLSGVLSQDPLEIFLDASDNEVGQVTTPVWQSFTIIPRV